MRNVLRYGLRALGLACGFIFLAMLGPGWAQIRFTPPQLMYNGSGFLAPGVILLTDGTAAAPSLSFATASNQGLYKSFAAIGWSSAGASAGEFGAGYIYVAATTSRLQLGADVNLARDGTAILQLGFDAATAAANTISGPDSTGSNATGGSLTLMGGDGTSGNAQGGALILRGGDNAGTGEEGTVQISDTGTKPTCAAGIRGALWYDAGGAGVADTFEVCAKQAAGDTYAWRVLATIP